MTERGLAEFVVKRISSYLLPELYAYRKYVADTHHGRRCFWCNFPAGRMNKCGGCAAYRVCDQDWCPKQKVTCINCSEEQYLCESCTEAKCVHPGCEQQKCRVCGILDNCSRCHKNMCVTHMRLPKTVLPGGYVIWGTRNVCVSCINEIDAKPRPGLGRCITCYQDWLNINAHRDDPQCIHK